MPNVDLNAVNLKEALWDTLNGLRTGQVEPGVANQVAAQAREIIRASRLQLNILQQAHQTVSDELVSFAAPGRPRQTKEAA